MFNVNERKTIMKKNYIQPAIEVNAMMAVASLLSESNPFNYGGSSDNADPLIPGSGEPV